MPPKFVFVGTCVNFPAEFVSYVKGREAKPEQVTYRWFNNRANLDAFGGKSLDADWAVTLWKSRTPTGLPVLYFVQSGIEHFFLRSDNMHLFDVTAEAAAAEDQGY